MIGPARFLRYCGTALLAAASDWLMFAVLIQMGGLPAVAALMTARIGGGAVSFAVNRHWTFGATGPSGLTRQGRRFLLLYAVSYASAVGLFALLTDGLGAGPYGGKIVTDALCFAGNYLAMALYVFHDRSGLGGWLAHAAVLLRRGCGRLAKLFPRKRGGRPAPIASAMPDAKRFWNDKILAWEDSRYSGHTGQGWLEWLAGTVSTSLRFRLDHAAAYLEPHVRGRRVVELGCGSGLLARRLIAAGATSYQGFDIADRAIARARATHADLCGRVSFDVAAVSSLTPLGDVVVLSLGLFDWLDGPDIAHVFAIGRDGYYLHALSERRASVQQSLHRAYVHLSYGRRTGFTPRYHRLTEIQRLLADQGLPSPQVIRHPRLRFGIFVSSLPSL